MENDYSLRIIEYLEKYEPYYIYVVVIVGLIGNAISFGVFIFTKFRFFLSPSFFLCLSSFFSFCLFLIKMLIFNSRLEKTNFILAALALSDIGFLLTLFLVNFKHFSVDFFNEYEYICKVNIYLHYVFGFLSAW